MTGVGYRLPMSSDAERPAMSDDPDGDVGREDQEAPGELRRRPGRPRGAGAQRARLTRRRKDQWDQPRQGWCGQVHARRRSALRGMSLTVEGCQGQVSPRGAWDDVHRGGWLSSGKTRGGGGTSGGRRFRSVRRLVPRRSLPPLRPASSATSPCSMPRISATGWSRATTIAGGSLREFATFSASNALAPVTIAVSGCSDRRWPTAGSARSRRSPMSTRRRTRAPAASPKLRSRRGGSPRWKTSCAGSCATTSIGTSSPVDPTSSPS